MIVFVLCMLVSCKVQVSASNIEGNSSLFSSDSFRIEGGYPLWGSVTIDGAKNSILPLMAAALLTDESLILTNVPDITDARYMLELLKILGAMATDMVHGARTLKLTFKGNVSTIKASLESNDFVRNLLKLSKKLRASYYILGPLVGRFGIGILTNPGGCNLGSRPTNLHVDAMRALGANVEDNKNFQRVVLPRPAEQDEVPVPTLKHTFPTISVGATINTILAAVIGNKKTFISNCSIEPEVLDLITCLRKMGANIERRARDIEIHGVYSLKGTTYRVIPDRFEAGTFMIAAAATMGNVTLKNIDDPYPLVGSLGELLRKVGCMVTYGKNYTQIICSHAFENVPVIPSLIPEIQTREYPSGFPTDLQSTMLALLSGWEGISNCRVIENIFEDRFKIVQELRKMGAQIEKVSSREVIIKIGRRLHGAIVMAQDLRGAAALCIAGLSTDKGEVTVVNGVYHLDRGYTSFEEKLRSCGAKIKRVLGGVEYCRPSWCPPFIMT